jgi:hypothetical protein
MLRWKKSGRARSACALSEATSQGRLSGGGEGEVAAARRAAEESELGRLDVQSAQDPEVPDRFIALRETRWSVRATTCR